MTFVFDRSPARRSSRRITVTGFADYQAKLRAAKVILDPAERRAEIWKQAQALAAKESLTVKQDDALLDEVTGLVEWPVALMGKIDDAFMTLPPEVMTTQTLAPGFHEMSTSLSWPSAVALSASARSKFIRATRG